MSEDLGQTHSPWPKRLLIAGIIAFILGAVGLGYTLPSISDGLIPDNFNDAVIEPGATVEVNLTGLRVYSLFQNTTESNEIDGSITILQDGEEVELREPSIFSGVGEMEYEGDITFSAMGWVQSSEATTMEFISQSNQTIYLVDQNKVSEEAFTQPAVLSSCFSLVVSACLLPVSIVLFLLRKKGTVNSSNVTLKTSDGRQLNLQMEGLTNSGAVLTTEQIYALARLQERAGPDGQITVDIQMPSGLASKSVPPPFSDRPDDNSTDAVKSFKESVKESQSSEIPISEIDTESSSTPTEGDQEKAPNWKDWDEG
ncbi:MAG: hypothetical protein NZ774_06190 [Candidatus Poseidoniales archaeon]|nr:hypothetical protein [Candidatus Poseidoniales archaeon]